MIAAMIDGVWLRAALSNWQEADSESARALLTAFVDDRLKEYAPPAVGAPPDTPAPPHGTMLTSINPATGAVLAEIRVDGAAEVDAAVARAQQAQPRWAAMTGAARA